MALLGAKQIFTAMWESSTVTAIIPSLLLACFIHRCLLYAYRILFHPLASIPGPFPAKFTSMYTFYREAITRDMTFEFHENLFPKYGPVVRIGPNKVRIKDPAAYHVIHAPRSAFKKDPSSYDSLGSKGLSTITDEDRHKAKRAVLDPIFSRKQVQTKYEDLVQEKCKDAFSLIRKEVRRGEIIDAMRSFGAMMGEVAGELAFGHSIGMTDPKVRERLMAADEATWLALMYLKYFPIVNQLLQCIPPFIAGLMDPVMAEFMNIRKVVTREVDEVVKARKNGQLGDHIRPRSIAELAKTLLPGNTKAEQLELLDDGINQFMAGWHTTAWAASVGIYYLAKCPHIQGKLYQELSAIQKQCNEDPIPYRVLERLPYLESLRLSFGVLGPLPRIVPKAGCNFAGRFIPGGTIIEIDQYGILTDPDIFNSPWDFSPDRWLDEPEKVKILEKFLVIFGRGSYNCIGQYVATMELYIALANLVLEFRLRPSKELEKEDRMRIAEAFVAIKIGPRIQVWMEER